MNRTTYFELKKPAGSDFYDVGDQNYNMDVIDAALHELSEGADEQKEHYKRLLDASVPASAWTESEYEDYPYQANVAFEGCTADYCVDVMFSPAQISMGIFAQFAVSGAGTVTIYSESVPSGSITIPVIELRK